MEFILTATLIYATLLKYEVKKWIKSRTQVDLKCLKHNLQLLFMTHC